VAHERPTRPASRRSTRLRQVLNPSFASCFIHAWSAEAWPLVRAEFTKALAVVVGAVNVHTHEDLNNMNTIKLVGALWFALVTVVFLAPLPAGAAELCPRDSVQVGPTCLDKYEASLWKIAPPLTQAGSATIRKIRAGTVTMTDLMAVGAVQLGRTAGDLVASGCPDTGNGCVNVYAVSIPGAEPARFTTWFQAAAAARNSFKRLPSNAEWQVGALGTPDSSLCNVNSVSVANMGSPPGCVSDAGALDMVGNVYEWVADWVPRSTTCVPNLFGTDDQNCLAGASTESGSGALLRGGGIFDNGPLAGVFAVEGGVNPSFADGQIGFRAAR
jgi:hypothetical protein